MGVPPNLWVRYALCRNAQQETEMRFDCAKNIVSTIYCIFFNNVLCGISACLGVNVMNIQKGKIVGGGRLQIPADIRRDLGFEEGDNVIMEVVNNELRVRSQREGIRRIQEWFKPYRPGPGEPSLSEELIADRRREAANE
jgi:antitoxin PrlF